MSMLKKVLLLIMAGMLSIFLFAGCKKTDENKASTDNNSSHSEESEQAVVSNDFSVSDENKHLPDDILIGDWKCTSVKNNDLIMPVSEYKEKANITFSAFISFYTDGSLSFTSVLGDKTEQCYTSYNNYGDTIALINDYVLKYDRKSDVLSLIQNESNQMMFERVKKTGCCM